MYPPEYQVHFRLSHPAMPATDIVRKLRIKPEWGWTKGEQRRTPAGRILKGVRKDTYLTVHLKPARGHGPAEVVERHSTRMLLHARFLRAFARSGGSIEYWVTMSSVGSAGDVFPHTLLQRLAHLHINLSPEAFATRFRS